MCLFLVKNSPRLGSLNEIYAQIVISSHGFPNGILQLSSENVRVPDGYSGPLVSVVRTDGLLGQVRLSFSCKSHFNVSHLRLPDYLISLSLIVHVVKTNILNMRNL